MDTLKQQYAKMETDNRESVGAHAEGDHRGRGKLTKLEARVNAALATSVGRNETHR